MYAIAPAPLSSATGQNPASSGLGGDAVVLAGFGMVDSHDRRPTCVVYNDSSTPSCMLLFRWLISTLVLPHFPLRAFPRCFVRTHCAPRVSATTAATSRTSYYLPNLLPPPPNQLYDAEFHYNSLPSPSIAPCLPSSEFDILRTMAAWENGTLESAFGPIMPLDLDFLL